MGLVACLWDSDTLAMEAKGKLDLVDAITGRFPRNPALYYQLRLQRVEREIKAEPGTLELYDDAGVACDRLGKGEEAIRWMARKKSVLDSLHTNDPGIKEHWYRYFANLGTFEIHKWFREGRQKERIGEAERARDHIAKAIEINPEAHFGRERIQLIAMEWAIAKTQGKIVNTTDDTFANWLRAENAHGKNSQDTIKGLVGLVVLGNAWESPDVFHALATLLAMSREGQLGLLAKLRTEDCSKTAHLHSQTSF